MGKIIWFSTVVVSLVVSVAINFNAISVTDFLIGSLTLALSIFVILTLLIKTVQNIKKKNKKAILFGVLSVVAIVLFYFGYLMFLHGGGKLPAGTPNHFRTNILTGQCDYGGGAPHVSSDPWYYKEGCDLPKDKLIDILKNSNQYEFQLNECNRLCEDNFEEIFCSEKVFLWGGQSSNKVRCDYLVNCDTISCN